MRIVLVMLLVAACGHRTSGGGTDGGPGSGDGSGGGGGGDSGGGGGDGGTSVTGGLDPGFGSGGVVVVSSAGAEHAYDVALQADGKIVVAGDAADGMLVLRFLDDGTLDPTFGTNGRVAFGGATARGNGVAIQADGKIVVGGRDARGVTTFARLTTNGTLDTTFGSGGVSSPITNNNGAGEANDVAIRPDGTIVFCGEAFPASGSVHLGIVGRLTSAGALDSAFGSNAGYSMLTAQRGGWFARLAIDTSDRIVAAGTVYYEFGSGNGHMLLQGRFASNGTLDGTFANGAQYAGDEETYTRDVAVLPDGRAISASMTMSFTSSYAQQMAYRTLVDGTRDTTFADNGEDLFLAPGMWSADGFAIALQPDGSPIVVGQGDPSNATPADVVVSRRLPGGGGDSAFGTSGALVFAVPGGDANPRASALAASGKLYVVGFTSTETSADTDIFVARVR